MAEFDNFHYLFLVRHGHRIDSIGQDLVDAIYPLDPNLSKLGILQAKELALVIERQHIEEIFTSPYLRTIHTAYWCANRCSQLIHIEPALSEYYYIKSNIKPQLRLLNRFCYYFPKISKCLYPIEKKRLPMLPDSNETEIEAEIRSSDWVQKQKKSKRILAVTHESVCHFLVRKLTKMTNWNYTPLGFCSISILKTENHIDWELVKYNDTSFLSSGEICR